jgi:ribonuclease VapC
MFIDTSAIIAILAREPDALDFIARIEAASVRLTSVLVILEAAMRLSSLLRIEPVAVGREIDAFLAEARVDLVPMDAHVGQLAIAAFAAYGKGRGHPVQLNLADCLSYACAKAQGVPLLYKGADVSRTDLA